MPASHEAAKVKIYFGGSSSCIDLTPDLQGSVQRGGGLNTVRLRRVTGTGQLGMTADVAGMRLNLTATILMNATNKALLQGGTGYVWIEDANTTTPRVLCFPAQLTARPISAPQSGATSWSINAIQSDSGAVEGAIVVSGSQKSKTGEVGYQRTGTTSIKPLTGSAVTASATNPVVQGTEYKAKNS